MKSLVLLFCMLFSIAGICQNNQDIPKSKTYYGKIKFHMTEVNFNNLKSGQNYVGLILISNITNKNVLIKEIVKDCGCVDVKISSKTVIPNENFPIEIKIVKAVKGKLSKKIFIYFVGEKLPVVISVKGNFI